MSSYSDIRDWTEDEKAEKAQIRAIHIEIPEDIRRAAMRASSVHEDPWVVVAHWMREEAAKVADDENAICAGGNGTARTIAAAIRKIGERG